MTADKLATIQGFEVQDAIHAGLASLAIEAVTPEPHWFPCGFAWVEVKIRKNHRLAKVFIANGWRWDDYAKAYTFRMPSDMYKVKEMWQSMDYAARCLSAFSKELNARGVPSYVNTRID